MLIMTIAATLAGAITYLAHMAQWAAIFGGGPARRRGRAERRRHRRRSSWRSWPRIAAMLVQLAVSRSREFQADATGAQLAGRPWGLSKALEKLEMAVAAGADARPTPATAHLFIVNPLQRRRAA